MESRFVRESRLVTPVSLPSTFGAVEREGRKRRRRRRSRARSRNEKSREENASWKRERETKDSARIDACTGLVYRHAQSTTRY